MDRLYTCAVGCHFDTGSFSIIFRFYLFVLDVRVRKVILCSNVLFRDIVRVSGTLSNLRISEAILSCSVIARGRVEVVCQVTPEKGADCMHITRRP